ncbi:MAG: DUF3800 domain-containing protein [Armatimonadetes bacterium]|nr:DUF3800 domain-containing protein [Armatimonadota bacterium]
MSRAATHVGFADESCWNTGWFRSLGLVTTSIGSFGTLDGALRTLLRESNVSEFKWHKLGGAKERFAAEKLCNFAVEKACGLLLRVDVLVWDIQDSRHKIAKRDDIANLERMYYHLFRNVLRARWPGDAIWWLHPDENSALKWETVQDCLESVSTAIELDRSLFTGGQFRIRLRREFGIEDIQPVSSKGHPLLQLADLFAGLAVFSREKFPEYREWEEATSQQKRLPLFDEADAAKDPSRSSKERFRILNQFDNLCKQKKLGVSLKTRRGLWTPKPENPINFWIYEPQHPGDKAPQKGNQ